MTDEPDRPAPTPGVEALRAVGARLEAIRRLEAGSGDAILRSIVETTVALLDAEASSLALLDPASGRLVFQVAAGPQGEPVVGLEIEPSEGVAGYVFTTGQPLAIADTSADPRFSGRAAATTEYTPRSLLAVPLVDDDGTIGVLEVLDKRDGTFGLRDVETASLFARQATVAIRASRADRDVAAILGRVLRTAAGDDLGPDDVDAVVAAAVEELAESPETWALADRLARLRAADPGELDLAVDILDTLLARAERQRTERTRAGLRGSHRDRRR